MPVGAQCVSRMPISWPWNTGRPWWPDCVISAIDGPSRSSRNSSNALRFVFGPSRRTSPDSHEPFEALLELLALGAGLGEAGREDHRELGLALQHLLERVDGAAGEDDREVEVAGDVEDRLVTRVAEHGLVLGVHGVERGAVLRAPTRRTCASSRCSASPTAPTRRSARSPSGAGTCRGRRRAARAAVRRRRAGSVASGFSVLGMRAPGETATVKYDAPVRFPASW